MRFKKTRFQVDQKTKKPKKKKTQNPIMLASHLIELEEEEEMKIKQEKNGRQKEEKKNI